MRALGVRQRQVCVSRYRVLASLLLLFALIIVGKLVIESAPIITSQFDKAQPTAADNTTPEHVTPQANKPEVALTENTTFEHVNSQPGEPGIASADSATSERINTGPGKSGAVSTDKPRSGHVNIWHAPRGCRGTWRTIPSRHSPQGFPYAVVRDAVVDRRPASARILGQNDVHGVVRIVLYVTTHLSAGLSDDGASVTFANGDLSGQVEYVTHVSPFLIPKVPGGYRLGLKTRYGQEVTEWQIGVRLEPNGHHGVAEDDVIVRAVRAGAAANIKVTVRRFDEELIPFHVELPLRCVMGWDPLPGMEGVKNSCSKQASEAKGAILFSGSALYGAKKRESKHYREVANFAARGLAGLIKFDAVAMSVVSDFSAEDVEFQCGSNKTCRNDLDEKNDELIRAVAETVEDELELIGVERELFSRIMIIPTCRLGSDANATEKGDPCRSSKRYGQYHATFFSHAMLAPFFKWAVSYDMDEFLSSVPSSKGSQVQTGRADIILDQVDAKLRGTRGDIIFPWLNFRVSSGNDSRKLSTGLMQGHLPKLGEQKNRNSSESCHYKAKYITDKHMEQKLGLRTYTGIRTWHARLGSSQGSCDYVPTPLV